ncbi:transcriptional regulator with XRE-family HTH domain [Salinibacter ruber]|uniref:helix-turn-helix domain-containing protein n=1 Tax=Salinibacter ruber TaxID=146919 RepID=UPI0021687F36|nr:helix-turn-helix transcriptional regulator [Salinibacter ruber]MCS3613531.1 transcriptional regulator with XRE-family HTH domain [Salinibacter ruber]MCS4195057.1 transcriptional regulator with XRE-family HTH domain [Salinibacter ruber]
MDERDLAQRVRELRTQAGLTQEEFGEQVGYSHSTVSKAENFREADGMIGIRQRIIERATGNEVAGPFFEEHEQ